MRRAGLLLAAAVLGASAVACGSGSGGDSKDSSVPYGAQTCSDWAGHLDSSQRWDAATELLANAKSADGDDGAPSTSTVKQFEKDLGTRCDQGSSDDLLATVADELYESNRAFYSL
jgi:hypothetical protein